MLSTIPAAASKDNTPHSEPTTKQQHKQPKEKNRTGKEGVRNVLLYRFRESSGFGVDTSRELFCVWDVAYDADESSGDENDNDDNDDDERDPNASSLLNILS